MCAPRRPFCAIFLKTARRKGEKIHVQPIRASSSAGSGFLPKSRTKTANLKTTAAPPALAASAPMRSDYHGGRSEPPQNTQRRPEQPTTALAVGAPRWGFEGLSGPAAPLASVVTGGSPGAMQALPHKPTAGGWTNDVRWGFTNTVGACWSCLMPELGVGQHGSLQRRRDRGCPRGPRSRAEKACLQTRTCPPTITRRLFCAI